MATYSGESIIGDTYQKAELRLCYCEITIMDEKLA